MRHLAMTGISTAAMISRMILGEAMRATPPSARICAGTRSRAMTETAPARSAISACLAVVTSMMTPPLSISARPVLRRRLVVCPLFCDMGGSLPGAAFSCQLSAISRTRIGAGNFLPYGYFTVRSRFAVPRPAYRMPELVWRTQPPSFARPGRARAPVPTWALALHKSSEHPVRVDGDEQALTAGQDFSFFVQDLGHVDVLAAFDLNLARSTRSGWRSGTGFR